MTFASKNLKVFSSYYYNDKKCVRPTPLKMRFLDDGNVDERVWGCSAFGLHDYLLELMNTKENQEEPLTLLARKANSHVSILEDQETDRKLQGISFDRGDSSTSLKNSNIQLRSCRPTSHTTDCRYSDKFTVHFEEVPSMTKFYSCELYNEDEEHITTISMATNQRSTQSLQVDINETKVCPKCNGKIVR